MKLHKNKKQPCKRRKWSICLCPGEGECFVKLKIFQEGVFKLLFNFGPSRQEKLRLRESHWLTPAVVFGVHNLIRPPLVCSLNCRFVTKIITKCTWKYPRPNIVRWQYYIMLLANFLCFPDETARWSLVSPLFLRYLACDSLRAVLALNF